MDIRLRDREDALSEDEQLGVVLIQSGIITIEQLGEALHRAKERGCNLARLLIEDKLLTEEQFVGTLAGQLGLEFVDLATYPVDPAAARIVNRCSRPALLGAADRMVGGQAHRRHGGPVQRVRHRRHPRRHRCRSAPGRGHGRSCHRPRSISTTAKTQRRSI